MTTQPTTMRFAHFQEESKHYNGLTAAYTRTDTTVFFAYALCSKDDQYEKSVGRKFSTENYMKHLDDQKDVCFIDPVQRVGCLKIEDIRAILRMGSITKILADHVIDNLTFMDMKHAIIQQYIVQYIRCHHTTQ